MVIVTFGQPGHPRPCVLLLFYSQGCSKMKTGTKQDINYPPWSFDITDNGFFCFSFAIISFSFLWKATSSQKEAVSSPVHSLIYIMLFSFIRLSPDDCIRGSLCPEGMLDEQGIWLWNYSQSKFFPLVIMENNIFAWWVHCLPVHLCECVQDPWWGSPVLVSNKLMVPQVLL